MNHLIIVAMVLIFAGCEDPAAESQIRAATPSPKSLKQSLVCTTTGVDGHLSQYSIEYTLYTYTDNERIASCRTINNTTVGVVLNLKCPSTDPLAMTYSIVLQSPNNPQVFYTQAISETLDPNTAACTVTNY